MKIDLPESWLAVLGEELEKDYFTKLDTFVDQEREEYTVFPPESDVFKAFEYCPFDKLKVFLIGQDPYHDINQAHGLSFSVRPGVKPPPSLVNMYKELRDDVGCSIPNNGYLVPWAEQGVLMLNAVLTVRAHKAGSHGNKGWEKFTDAAVQAANDREDPVVFVLWGGYAKKKGQHIDRKKHRVVESAHPSPLSASKGFFGSAPFSKINGALEELGKEPINWQIPDIEG